MSPATIRLERLQRLLLSLNAIGGAEAGSDALLERIVTETMAFTDAGGAVVERVEGDAMVYLKAAGQIAAFEGFRLARAHSLSGLCVESGAVQRCDDTEHDARVNRAACREIGIRSMLVVPLVFGAEVIGVLKASSAHVAAFNDEHAQALQLAAGVIAAVLGRQTLLERSDRQGRALSAQIASGEAERAALRTAAFVDSLTGLPNRRAFENALDAAIEQHAAEPQRIAVLFIDINDFKRINDTLGHRIGDLALKRLADLLRRSVAAPHLAARLAGDEFVLLLRDIDGDAGIAQLCAQLLHEAAQPQALADGVTLSLSLSIGVAVQHDARLTHAEWLRRADDAMYRAKKRGGGFAVHGIERDA